MNENNPPMMLPNGYVYGYNVRAGGGAGAERPGVWGLSCPLQGGLGAVEKAQDFLAGVPAESDFHEVKRFVS